MIESANRHDETTRMINELKGTNERKFINQEASISALEKQIGQLSKFLQERLPKTLPSNVETNPRYHVKVISIIEESTYESFINTATNEYPLFSNLYL